MQLMVYLSFESLLDRLADGIAAQGFEVDREELENRLGAAMAGSAFLQSGVTLPVTALQKPVPSAVQGTPSPRSSTQAPSPAPARPRRTESFTRQQLSPSETDEDARRVIEENMRGTVEVFFPEGEGPEDGDASAAPQAPAEDAPDVVDELAAVLAQSAAQEAELRAADAMPADLMRPKNKA